MEEKENNDRIPKPSDCPVHNCKLEKEYVNMTRNLKDFEDKNIALNMKNKEYESQLKEKLSSDDIKNIQEKIQKDSMVIFLENNLSEQKLKVDTYMKSVEEKTNENSLLKAELKNIETNDEKQFKIKDLDNKIAELEDKKNKVTEVVKDLNKNLGSFDTLIKIKTDVLKEANANYDAKVKKNKEIEKLLKKNLLSFQFLKRKSKLLNHFLNRKENKNKKLIEKLNKEIAKNV